MLCIYGHDHTITPVVTATYNPTQPRRTRPYHCEECQKANPHDKREDYWERHATEEAAKAAGHPACHFCFRATA
jgi:hypothetical protein